MERILIEENNFITIFNIYDIQHISCVASVSDGWESYDRKMRLRIRWNILTPGWVS